MKLAIASDIHIEFGYFKIKNKENADALILAGDVCLAKDIDNYLVKSFFSVCAKEFPIVYYILGNHEHYNGDFQETFQIMKDFLVDYPNIKLMNNTYLHNDKFEDIGFFGATMWTDMNKGNPLVENIVKNGMNDFSIIMNGNEKFTPSDARKEFYITNNCLDFICKEIKKINKKLVVITHHAPCELSVNEKYKGQDLNYGYYSDLSEFIFNHTEIVLWIHGHTHYPFDYELCETRIVCNPRGYLRHESNAKNFELKYVEI